jgi:hypothetical protein
MRGAWEEPPPAARRGMEGGDEDEGSGEPGRSRRPPRRPAFIRGGAEGVRVRVFGWTARMEGR